MKDKDILNEVGKILMASVRDEAIEKFEMILAGEMKAPEDQKLYRNLQEFSSEQTGVLKKLIANFIDETIYNFLYTVEENDAVELIYKYGQFGGKSLKKISDGLSGELFSEEGWIAKYSKYK